MRSDVHIRHDGFKALFSQLDPVEAERFLVMVQQGNLDYTEWRKKLWTNQSIDEISQKATLHWKNKQDNK